jgi:cobalt-zinc-cadmium efflux system membrane fusion protein
VSPIDGTVAHIAVNVGSKVTGDATMLRVVNNGKLHVDLFLYEQDIAKVKVGQKIDLSLTNLPGKNYTAKVFAIGSAFESETKTIPVHAEITGDKWG